MQRLKLFPMFALCVLLLASLLSPAQAQNADVDVILTPEEADVELGEGLQFEAFAFEIAPTGRFPVEITNITWKVEPDTMGTISEDGFFIAGRHAGEAVVTASVVIRNRTVVKTATVFIGRKLNAFFKVKVVPERAVVPVGGEQQFHVVVRNRLNDRIVRPKFVSWRVRPEKLGKISSDGLFKAGDETGNGKVVATVEIDGLRLHAHAHVAVSPPATASISGQVVSDTDNLPIEGGIVRAIRLGKVHWIQKDTTDAEGNYQINELIPGVYVVVAHAKGFVPEFFDDTRNYLEATPISLQPDEAVTGIDFSLSEGGKITGTVVTDPDSLPLAGAHVVAFLVVNPKIAKHVMTGEDGTYQVDALPTGTYAVYANAVGYRGEFYDDAKEFSGADFVQVEEPNTVAGIDFALGSASAISGMVTNEVDGTPIAGARIRVFKHRPHPFLGIRDRVFRETRTNDAGEYIIQVPPGGYFVAASAEGFNGEFYDDARDLASATLVEVVQDSHATNIDFALTPRGSISGTVTNQDTGEPIAGAVVKAFKENNVLDPATDNAGFRAKTDSSGNYTIENVPIGKYLVVAGGEGFLREFYKESPTKEGAELVPVEDGGEVTGIDFTLQKGGSISGVVYAEPDSVPLPRALVRVFLAGTDFHRRTHTNENGEFKISGLPSGQYYVQAIAEGFVSEFFDNVHNRGNATLVEVVAPDETPNIDFALSPRERKRGTIAGLVVSDEDDGPIDGAVIIAVSPTNLRPHITFSGENGRYELTDLPPGTYFVFAWAEGFIGEFYKDAKRFQNADEVIVLPDNITPGIDFSLQPQDTPGLYVVRGNIRSAATGAPVEGALVHARVGDHIQLTAVTDANGNYAISGLPAGEYKIEASGVGYATGFFGGSDETSAASVAVGGGQDAASVDLTLEEDNVTSVGSQNGSSGVPESFALFQNYPNPFNPETTIKYQLPEAAHLTVKIYNILGQEIRTLVDKQQAAGVYNVTWDGKDSLGRQVASGIYIYQVKAGDKFRSSRRMLMLK